MAKATTPRRPMHREQCFLILKNQWSKEMLQIFKVLQKILPIVKDSADDFGQTTKFGSKIPSKNIETTSSNDDGLFRTWFNKIN